MTMTSAETAVEASLADLLRLVAAAAPASEERRVALRLFAEACAAGLAGLGVEGVVVRVEAGPDAAGAGEPGGPRRRRRGRPRRD
jgi:hypothetical protein